MRGVLSLSSWWDAMIARSFVQKSNQINNKGEWTGRAIGISSFGEVEELKSVWSKTTNSSSDRPLPFDLPVARTHVQVAGEMAGSEQACWRIPPCWHLEVSIQGPLLS